MTHRRDELPQEWPDHLDPNAATSPVKSVSPVGTHILDFAKMDSVTFEQFCWWLLKKDRALSGCKRLGQSGARQGGVDLIAFDEHQSDKLHVFECKAWTDFPPRRLREAIDVFLKNDWSGATKTFTIILAQKEAGPALMQEWYEQKQRLKAVGVEGDLWAADTLTLKVQDYPDILSKFFSWPGVEHFANLWMQRVGFYELASRAIFDPRPAVAQRALELVGPSDDERAKGPSSLRDTPSRQFHQSANNWQFNGPWFSLSAILPDRRFTHASAAITFNRPDLQGITLTVDHGWLMKHFLFRQGAPLTSRHRGFVFSKMPHDDNRHIVDFPNCRLCLDEKGVREIADIADLLTDAMRTALRTLDADWSAEHFPFILQASRKVALATMRADAWQEIGRFAVEHDVSRGFTPWHMFDGNPHMLKPFHETANTNFDAGYHAIIQANPVEGLSGRNELVLSWQPDGLSPTRPFSPRGWWPCDYAFQWLNDSLIPEVKRHVLERDFGRTRKLSFRSRANDAAVAWVDELFAVRDLRQRPLIRNGTLSADVPGSVQALQQFFENAETPEPYIRQRDMENLYRACAFLARHRRGHARYIGSKLNLPRAPVDHDDLVRMIHNHIDGKCVAISRRAASNVFKAMLDLIGVTDNRLSNADRAAIRDYLAPFATLSDDAALVHRHTHWA